jgi:Flp pilus assembly protein TadB
MTNIGLFLDAVSPVVLAIPLIILLVAIAITTFGILWLIAYIRKRNADK